MRADVGSTFGVFIMVWLRILIGAAVVASAAAYAQSSNPPAATAATAGTQHPATTLQYQSALRDYRPFTEIEIVSWQRANDDAARLGGHMGQMKHDAMPAMAPNSMPSMTTPAKPAPPESPVRAAPVR